MKSNVIMLIAAVITSIIIVFGAYFFTSSPLAQAPAKEIKNSAGQNPEKASNNAHPASGANARVISASGTGETDAANTVPQNAQACTPESKNVESCEPIDHPVCGWYDLQHLENCNWGPCVRGAFPNECEACRTSNIIYWTDGDCPIHG